MKTKTTLRFYLLSVRYIIKININASVALEKWKHLFICVVNLVVIIEKSVKAFIQARKRWCISLSSSTTLEHAPRRFYLYPTIRVPVHIQVNPHNSLLYY